MARIKLCHHSVVRFICRTQPRIIRCGCYMFWYHEAGTQRRISQTGLFLRSRTSLTEEVQISERLFCKN
ncbi:hypothetical protein T09_7328 [Trichinella sp. T9]|uniref:Uncharacterized protein n=1 Tax=Trichinella murrelli TaxID=144512 RepID=A0A0V0TNZ7_9BILA|nr:hypothetical protein T05_9602 [Trichinella murrelli]KRX58868.1 hypothetical protein T09_7328 [Trichinella sp. T9]